MKLCWNFWVIHLVRIQMIVEHSFLPQVVQTVQLMEDISNKKVPGLVIKLDGGCLVNRIEACRLEIQNAYYSPHNISMNTSTSTEGT